MSADDNDDLNTASETWAEETAPNASAPIQGMLAEAFRAGAQWMDQHQTS